MILYKILLNIVIGILTGIYLHFNTFISIIGIFIIIIVNLKNKKILQFLTLGIVLGYSSVLVPRSFIQTGIVTYIGNNNVFIENNGLYFINLQKYNLKIGDRISFTHFDNNIRKIHSQTLAKPMFSFIVKHRENIKAFLKQNKYFSFWLAILIGDKSYMPYENIIDLMNSNIYHLIVISGFHLSFIYYLIYNILWRITQRSLKLNYYCTRYAIYDIIPHVGGCIGALYYFSLSVFGLASIRAILMIILKKTGFSSRTILLSLMIISLLYNPRLIFNKGFILSYTVTFFILEKQSNINIALFTSLITQNVNIFSIFNNLIGSTILYILLPVGFIAILTNNISILNIFNKLIEIFIHHLPKYNFSVPIINNHFFEIIALLNILYIQNSNEKYLYFSFLIFALANFFSF